MRGTQAMNYTFDDMAEKMKSKHNKPKLKELEMFHESRWLLTLPQQVQFTKWVKQLSCSDSAEKGEDSQAEHSQKGPKTKISSTKAEIMKFFRPKQLCGFFQ